MLEFFLPRNAYCREAFMRICEAWYDGVVWASGEDHLEGHLMHFLEFKEPAHKPFTLERTLVVGRGNALDKVLKLLTHSIVIE